MCIISLTFLHIFLHFCSHSLTIWNLHKISCHCVVVPVKIKFSGCTPNGCWIGPIKYGLSVCLSIHLFIHLSKYFSGLNHQFFHHARNSYQVVHDSWIFQKKICLEMGKTNHKRWKKDVFELIEKCCLKNLKVD